MNRTKIEYLDFTWNPIVGCSGFGRRLMLCDDCCVCYNHCPGGKYWDVRMDGKRREECT